MARQGLRREIGMTVLLGTGVWIWTGGFSTANAAEKETRIFTIKIDGRQAGRYQMTITSPDDHTFLVDGRADVSISYFLRKYEYFYQGTEVWKDGRLVHLKSKTTDDGKHFEVLAQADGDMLRVRVNGKEFTVSRPDLRTTTYWRLPEPRFRNQAVALIDCDTGKYLRADMQYVGTQQVTAAGQVRPGAHYRLRGDVTVDAWYDAQERLIHEESLDDGHRIVFDLVRIDR
jgi:hypothetical protein